MLTEGTADNVARELVEEGADSVVKLLAETADSATKVLAEGQETT